jgi:hypothetical protein
MVLFVLQLVTAVASASAHGTVAAADSTWYRATHIRDLTGDGTPDTLILTARGSRVDSLTVTFRIRSQGQQLYRETWLSTWYFQYDLPIDSIPERVKRDRVFKHLHEFFDAQNFSLLDTTPGIRPWHPTSADDDDPRSTIAFDLKYSRALDSLRRQHIDSVTAEAKARDYASTAPIDTQRILAAWEGMVRARPVTFAFYSGGEYSRIIAWSEGLRRFVIVFSCC